MKKTSFLISFIISAFVFSCSNRSTAKKTDDKEITATTTKEQINTKTLRVLLYSKANAWVHEDAIAAGKEIFPKLAKEKRMEYGGFRRQPAVSFGQLKAI